MKDGQGRAHEQSGSKTGLQRGIESRRSGMSRTPNANEPRAVLRDELTRRLKARLLSHGWELCDGHPGEIGCFQHLLPPPDTTFALRNPEGGEPCQVALHFANSEQCLWYACTMRRPNGEFAQEHGWLDVTTGQITLVDVRGDMSCPRRGA